MVEGGLGQLFHGDEPLHGEARLDDGAGALGAAHLVGVVLHLDQVASRVECSCEGLAGLEPVLSLEFSADRVDRAVGVEHVDDLEVVLLAEFVVVRVVGGGHLEATRSELAVDVLVEDDRDAPAGDGDDGPLAVEVGVAFVLRMDADGRVGEDGLRSGRGDGEPVVRAFDLVAHVVELGLLLGVEDLLVGDGCEGLGVPIDHAQAAVDVAFGVQVEEGVDDAAGIVLVQREVGPLPVAAGAKFAELLQDDAAVFAGPVPGVLEEGVAAEVGLLDALVAELADHLGFGGNGGVVGSRHPAGILALHPRAADEDILNGVVEHVAHVEHARHVGRGDHYGVGLPVVRDAAEGLGVFPDLVPAVFDGGRIVMGGDLLGHGAGEWGGCGAKFSLLKSR